MSLRVWLPLNGDLTNNGLSDISVTNNGATVDNAGKIGKCYYLSGSPNFINTGYFTNIGTNDFSIALWIKIPTITTGTYYTICSSKTAGAASVGFGIYWNYSQKKFLWSTADGSGATEIWMATAVDSIVYDKWIHLVMIRNNSDPKKGYFYINGVRYELASVPAIRNIATAPYTLALGKCWSNSYYLKAYYNDFRIYDHALSPKEVKLLSQGLVCHYKLSDIYATDNLIPNGYGQDGAIGWNNSTNFSTSEIPSGHSEIKASFYGGNTTTTFIPISQGTTYTLSAYLKAKGSGTSYPSIFPYDADKHIIMAYNCADGFSNSYRTTLAQPLKKGDTVIYATDLSVWTTGDNYYFHVAIFGYKDSQGRVYPDMGYTYDSPVFGTRTDKSHINKTNNTITLNSAFTGEDRPAGTVICQATEGNTYYYPFGAVTTSSVSDWTLKTAVLSPSTTHRLKYAKYINYMAYSGLYHAGIKLVDNNFSEPYVLDSSGYNRHGNIVTSGLVASVNSPRNNICTYFNGTAQISRESISAETRTISFWLKTTKTNQVCCFADYKSRLGFGFKSDGTIVTTCSSFNIKTYSPSAITDNVWHHIGIVKKTDDSDVLLYVDGILQSTRSGADSWTHTTDVFTLTGRSYGSPAKMTCYLSDFRLYATALSAADIQELYNAPVSVANTGAMLTQGEFVEVAT